MKVAIDISSIIYGTGVSVYTRNLVSNLIHLYPQDQFLLFGGSLRRREELKTFARRLKAETNFYPLPPSFLDLLWNSFHFLNVESLIGKVDLIHTSDWTEPPSHLVKVTTVHDLIPLKYPQTTTSSIKRAHRKRLAWIQRESTKIIAVSQSTKKDLILELKIPENKINVTPEGVEDFFSPQTPDLVENIKRKYHLKGRYLFSLSTLEPRKNQSRLIEAFIILKKDYPDLELLIGGRTGWGDGLQAETGVQLPGYIPDADLPALYSGCEAYVLPSLYEGFSLSHLQAMACGAAVVGSNISSMPEVIGQAGVLVDPSETLDIVEGIKKAIENKTTFSTKALNRAALFTWEETAKLTMDTYKEALKNENRL